MSIKNDFKGNIKTLLWIILITILVIVLLIPRKIINENLLFLWTGISRSSSTNLVFQKKNYQKNERNLKHLNLLTNIFIKELSICFEFRVNKHCYFLILPIHKHINLSEGYA